MKSLPNLIEHLCFKVPDQEKKGMPAAAAHSDEVTAGYVAANKGLKHLCFSV
jgi:hypothetical protein